MKNIVGILALLSLAACATAPPPKPAPITESNRTTSMIEKPVSNTGIENNADIEASRLVAEKVAVEKLAAEKLAADQALQKQSVYFDFDKSTVKPEYNETVEQQAAYINSHQNDHVSIEGNTDERGSDEYNLALGQRRATAVQKNLELLGVQATRLNTVSFGSEEPRLTCHAEVCWQDNRRVDFDHKTN